MPDGHHEPLRDAVAATFRREYGRTVAVLVRDLGSIDDAEDAVQDAFDVALRTWPRDGVPANPQAWMVTTARHRALDRARRETLRPSREQQADGLHQSAGAGRHPLHGDPGTDPTATPTVDDELRLIFLCCHPTLSDESKVALTLRLVGGLTTTEIARAFRVPDATMGQRLSRAKARLKDVTDSDGMVDTDAAEGGHESFTERLAAVLAVIYLIYNEGYVATGGDDLGRDDLCREATRLAREFHRLLPAEPEVRGLLALLLLLESRRPARTGPDGELVTLADQDRNRWDRALIAEGQRLVRACLAANRPGPYQLQAAIQAVHSDAPIAAATDWPQIVALYDHLLSFLPTPVVAVNRAVAVCEAGDPAAALEALEALDAPGTDGQHGHIALAVRAFVLERLGRGEEAAALYRAAAEATTNRAERDHLHARMRPTADQ